MPKKESTKRGYNHNSKDTFANSTQEQHARELYSRAKYALKEGLYDRETEISTAFSRFMDSADTYLESGNPRSALKVLDKTEEIFKKIDRSELEHPPNYDKIPFGRIHFYRGIALARLGKEQYAKEELAKLKEANKNSIWERPFSQEIGELEKELYKTGKKAKPHVLPVIAFTGLLAGIFFLSNSITGNAIASLSNKTTSFLGAGLLIIGLVAGFFWLKSKKK